ncbi:hypothetical protein HZA33_00810 [Candidatus Pacearchaeota archaeon]|nr:hypothetical protein [Candidatus Pacearchaeota archaeon]
MKKRTRIEIIQEILEMVAMRKGKIKQTHLMYKANLSYKLLKQYVDELISKGMLEQKREGSNIFIFLKPKGQEFLIKYRKMKEFQETFGI